MCCRETQGKLGRFHQALKRALLQGAHFRTLLQRQAGMDCWRDLYNPHRTRRAPSQKPALSRCQSSPRTCPEKLLEGRHGKQ
ncbi:integrase core domain-containing protein [Pseudomonas nitroreducens]|uniref:integrase core domain-containing protein n=1 Tax=Pseudomonas TaxID=286 RepID=UPI0012FD7960